MYFVRFFKVGGSLSEQPVGGDADVHGKAEPGVNLVLQPVGKVHRIAVERGGACHVAEGLVDAVGVHRGRIFFEKCHELAGTLHIDAVVRGIDF